jgi:hypothetical protein
MNGGIINSITRLNLVGYFSSVLTVKLCRSHPSQLAGSMILATQCYVAREDISNENLFNAFRRKADIERRSSIENL